MSKLTLERCYEIIKNSDGKVEVIAFKITDKEGILFICPFCASKYNKKGEPTVKSKLVIHEHGHEHGHEDNYKPRVTYRAAHCDRPGVQHRLEFKIIINASTFGVLLDSDVKQAVGQKDGKNGEGSKVLKT